MDLYCEIIDDTFIGGKYAPKGKKYQVDEGTLKDLVRCKKAIECEAPKGATPTATKSQAKEV